MKKYYSFIVFLFTILIFTAFTPVAAEAGVHKGMAGKNAVWKYNTDTKTLTITGRGALNRRIKLEDKDFVSVKKIVIKEGITSIDHFEVFENVSCEGRPAQLVLPDSLRSLATASFKGLKISSITIPKNLKDIAPGAFLCWMLEEIHVSPENQHFAVKDNVLFSKDGSRLVAYPAGRVEAAYRIPVSVKKIAPLAFARNRYIKQVVLHKNLRALGAGAFFGCNNLEEINLHQAEKLKKITDFHGYKMGIYLYNGSELDPDDDPPLYHRIVWTEPSKGVYRENFDLGTFEGTDISSIRIPDNVRYMSEDTFKDCFRLREITFGRNFTGEINMEEENRGKSVLLYELQRLESVRFAEGNPKYTVRNNIIYSRDGSIIYQVLKKNTTPYFVIEGRVTQIADGAFYKSETLETVRVKGSLKKIGWSAFAGCGNLFDFLAKGDIDEIGRGAFRQCGGLESFRCRGYIKRVDAEAFYDCGALREARAALMPEYVHKTAFGGYSSTLVRNFIAY